MENDKLEIVKLFHEMGEKRVNQYIKAYLAETKDREINMQQFQNVFTRYIDYCKDKNENNLGTISITGFKFFLSGMDFHKIMKQIEEVNSREDKDYVRQNEIFKCKKCSWEGSEPTSWLMHDENYEHYYIYMCPKCGSQL